MSRTAESARAAVNPRSAIYLDNNATTRPHPAVLDAMQRYYARGLANPASQHGLGRAARDVLEECRDCLMELLGATPGMSRGDQLIFTSGATEANNLALRGLATDKDRPLVVSALEHPSVLACAQAMAAQQGYAVSVLPSFPDGKVDLDLLSHFSPPPQGVSLMLANHETGVLQPVRDLVQHVSTAGWSTWIHTDAVQVVGKQVVNFRELGVSALTCSAHKFHGPAGIGALLLRGGLQVQPQCLGGSQQLGQRPGTEPVALAVGMRMALELALQNLHDKELITARRRDALQRGLMQGDPTAVVQDAAPRLPNTLHIAWPGLNRQALLLALDLAGVACATGSACESGSSEPSPVLRAMGCDELVVQGAVRFSLATDTTDAEIEEAIVRINRIVTHLRRGH